MAEDNSQNCILDLDDAELRIREKKLLKDLNDVQLAKNRLTVKQEVLALAEGNLIRQRYLEFILEMFGRRAEQADESSVSAAADALVGNVNCNKNICYKHFSAYTNRLYVFTEKVEKWPPPLKGKKSDQSGRK